MDGTRFFTNLLYYTNNASNFFLYCVAGTRFRKAMCQMFSCRRSRPEGRVGGQAAVDQVSASGKKIGERRHRSTTEEPRDAVNSSFPAAEAAGCITLSSNVTVRPSI